MYAAYFGLKENPFSLSPEPDYLFLSEQHRDALNCLIYGIKEKKGFILISGDIGLGKTTICRSLINSLDHSVETALIFNTAISDLEKMNDEDFKKMWVVKSGEQVYYNLPKNIAIRGWSFSHLFHHRGQLSVYLRLLEVPVPGMYGPSADESM